MADMTLEKEQQVLRQGIQSWSREELETQYVRLMVIARAINASQIESAKTLQQLTQVLIGKFEQSSSDD